MNDQAPEILLVYSGGLDSSCLLHELVLKGRTQMSLEHPVVCVNFQYGSKHNRREYVAATRICKYLKVELLTIDLRAISQYLKSSLLIGGEAIPHGHYQEKSMKSTVVPFRNGIMLSIAVGIAESRQIDCVYYAAHMGDHAIYPDCRVSFISSFNEAAQKGTYNTVSIMAPYQYLTKGEILKRTGSLSILPWTWTCYEGGEIHCGRCGACTERKEAFEEAEIVDRTVYAV